MKWLIGLFLLYQMTLARKGNYYKWLGSKFQGGTSRGAPLFLAEHVNTWTFCILQPQMETYFFQNYEWGGTDLGRGPRPPPHSYATGYTHI